MGDQPVEDKSHNPREDASIVPSPNLLITALSRSHVARQDDLRESLSELDRVRVVALEKFMTMRFEDTEKLINLHNKCALERAELVAKYEAELKRAETGRIDAIRTVDVNAVSVASARAADQATALANQVATQAEIVRKDIQTTAAVALANQTQQFTAVTQQFTTVMSRITSLEQQSAEGKGKQAYSDPAFSELLSEVKGLRESGRQTTGVQQGVGSSWQLLVAIIGIAAAVFMAYQASTRAPVSPQVIYAPAPAVSAAPLPK
jgi:hypothetical protein